MYGVCTHREYPMFINGGARGDFIRNRSLV